MGFYAVPIFHVPTCEVRCQEGAPSDMHQHHQYHGQDLCPHHHQPRSCCAQLLYLKRKQTKQNKKIGYFNTGPGTPPQSYGSLSSPAWPLVMSSLALSGNENGGQYRRQNSNSNSLNIPPQVRHSACPPVHHYHTFPGPDLPLLPPCRDPDLPLLHPCLDPLLKMFSK